MLQKNASLLPVKNNIEKMEKKEINNNPKTSASAVDDDYKNKIQEARLKSPSLEELSKSYDSIDNQGELKADYDKSVETMKSLDLIAKANAEKLSSDELIILTTEMRKQGVIGVRIAELEFKKYEDRVPKN